MKQKVYKNTTVYFVLATYSCEACPGILHGRELIFPLPTDVNCNSFLVGAGLVPPLRAGTQSFFFFIVNF